MILDQSDVDYLIDWQKTILTLNSAFIAIFLIGAKSPIIQPLSWLAAFFIISITLGLISNIVLIKYRREFEKSSIDLFHTLLFGASFTSFLIPLVCVAIALIQKNTI